MPKIYFTTEGLDARAKVAFDLDRSEVTIGAAEDNDINESDESSIAPYHCVLKRVVGGYVIEDLNANGLTYQGQQIPRFMLENGMEFSVGGIPVLYAYSKEELALLMTESGAQVDSPVSPTLAPPTLAPPTLAPQPAASVQPALNTKRKVTKKYEGGSSINPLVGIVIFVLVATLGLFGGLYLKHNQETGGNLINDLKEETVVPVWK